MSTSKTTEGNSRGLAVGILVPGLPDVPEAMRPFTEVAIKLQAEFLELWGDRCGAWLEWPEQYCGCKNLDDLTKAQSEYLARMQGDYSRFMRKMLEDTMIGQDEYIEPEAERPIHLPREAA